MDNTGKKTDRRVVKTKKAIRNAFAFLLAEKDINEITIKDIADTADINRKTFYNYYSGIHQVVEEIEDELIAQLDELVSDIEFKGNLKDPYPFFEKITQVISNDFDFYGHLMRTSANASLVSKITESLKEKVKTSFFEKMSIDSKTIDIIAEYVFSGMMAVYRNWFNSYRDSSIEEVSEKVSILMTSGINGLLNAV